MTLVDPRSRPTPLSLAPGLLRAMAAHRDILTYEPFTRVLSVDPAGGTVETEVGRLRFDFLSLIPPNRAPRFVADAGLGDPFVEVDAQTFRSLADERIYAVGDVADTPYARTAYTAVSSGRIAAQFIARALGAPATAARPPQNVCFPQVSATGALRIETSWIHESGADGAPHVKATGTVDNRATPGNLRRRPDWEASVRESCSADQDAERPAVGQEARADHEAPSARALPLEMAGDEDPLARLRRVRVQALEGHDLLEGPRSPLAPAHVSDPVHGREEHRLGRIGHRASTTARPRGA